MMVPLGRLSRRCGYTVVHQVKHRWQLQNPAVILKRESVDSRSLLLARYFRTIQLSKKYKNNGQILLSMQKVVFTTRRHVVVFYVCRTARVNDRFGKSTSC